MRKLLVSGLFISFGLFIGRLSGFVRETFIASNFGATEQTDLIIVFLSTPDILVNLLVGGALGMALIPEFKRLEPQAAITLYRQVLALLMVLFCMFGLLAYLFSSQLLTSFAPGLSHSAIQQYGNIFAVTFVAIPLTVASGVTTAFLHYRDKFLIPALGTLIFNTVLILSLYFAKQSDAEYLLLVVSVGVCAGAFVRWSSQVLNTKISPFSFATFSNNLITNSLVRRYFYCVFTGSIIFLIPVVSRAIASESGPGELSLVNYAIKLVEFPLGVVLTVFSIVFFPRFSGLYAEGDDSAFLETFKRVLLSVIATSFAVFVPLHYFSSSVVYLIYDWGQLEVEQLNKIAIYFRDVSLTLPFQGINALLIAVLASRRDTLSPLVCSSFLAIIFITVGYGFIKEITDIFYLMVLTYALLSVTLLLIVKIKHHVDFISSSTFVVDFFKLALSAMLYYWLLSQLSFTQQSVWIDMFVASISGILFLVLCFFLSQDIRRIIKI